jgi:basic amino acid/polyamine antiporter, APA family
VFQVGQPRIWMSMSRDGLLPPIFSKLHPKYRTPFFASIVAGILVAVPSLFMNLTEVTDLTSIGTLFAFILVSGGILILNPRGEDKSTGFKVPYMNSRWFLIPLWIIIIVALSLSGVLHFKVSGINAKSMIQEIPIIIFMLISIWISTMAILRKWSLLPVLGLLTNLYLMSELGITNWLRFLIWLVIGLTLYFSYGSKNSLLRKDAQVD